METTGITGGITMSVETAIAIVKETIENRRIRYYFKTTYDENCNRFVTLYICEYYSKTYINCIPLAEFTHEWRAEKAIDELYRLKNDVTEDAVTDIIQGYNGKDLHNFNQFWKRFQKPIKLLQEVE